MGYGFRVYSTGVCKGPRTTVRLDHGGPLPSGGSTLDRVERAMSALAAMGTLSTAPNLDQPQSWEQPDPHEGDIQMRVVGCERIPDGGHLLLKVKYGQFGEFQSAFGLEDEVDLTEKTANRTYRALLLTPASGTEARLVVETHGQRCPVTMLIRWIGRADYLDNTDEWTRLRVKQLMDKAKLAEMIKNSDSIEAILTEKHGTNDDRERVKLSIKTKVASRKANYIETMLSWAQGDDTDGYVVRLEEIAGFDPEALDEARLRFTDARLVITEHGRDKTINPESVQAKFTYPVTEEIQPPDDVWLQKVRVQLTGALSEGTDIQW